MFDPVASQKSSTFELGFDVRELDGEWEGALVDVSGAMVLEVSARKYC